MRHDMRTPLTGIVGFSDIIQTEAQSPIVKEYAENLVAREASTRVGLVRSEFRINQTVTY